METTLLSPTREDVSMARCGTILVAEDDENDAFIFQCAFADAKLPHCLRFVPDGKQAIHYLQGTAPYNDRRQFPMPDLLLLDLKMPRVDGFDVLHWLQLSSIEGPPVIVVSGSNLDADRRRALALGARGFYVKSSSLTETRKFFKEACERWLVGVS